MISDCCKYVPGFFFNVGEGSFFQIHVTKIAKLYNIVTGKDINIVNK